MAVNGKLKAAITEKDSLLAQTTTLESELAIKIAEVQRLSTEQNTTKGELMEQTQILTTLQSEKEVLQSSLSQKTTDIAALTTQKTNLETQLTTLQSENAKLQEDLKFCRSKNTAMSLYGKSFLPKFDYFSRDVNSVIARVPGVVEISNFATDPGGVTHHYSFNIENGVLSLNRESIPGGTYSYEYLPHSDWCNILIGGKVAYSCNGHSLKEILPNGTEIIRTAQEVFCEVHGLTFDRRVR
ncbi:MAG: hypothetical protein RR400_04565 [Clostridia bacterium]